MHEMGIALQIIEIAAGAIPQGAPAGCVRQVNVKVGKLSAVVPESLRFCFDIASRDTVLAGARLAIEEIPVTARCNGCENNWTITEPAFSCPACGGGDIRLLSGRELDVDSIEVDD
jgi:hydrogenase nickel incorporation protein HypA/HybF